jgi:predicted nucleic-acid-binding Zn-ribbon protein
MRELEITESIQRRLQDAACESCGASDWNVHPTTQALVLMDLGRGATVRPVTCNNCGLVRLYSTQIGR